MLVNFLVLGVHDQRRGAVRDPPHLLGGVGSVMGRMHRFGVVFPAPSCAHFSPREENPSSPRGGRLFGASFGWWRWLGVPAGLTEPLPGHERCVLELAATEPV